MIKNCKNGNKCCFSSQTHKTITEYGPEMQKAMNNKMEKEEYKKEYSKRLAVEDPYGILKNNSQKKKKS